MAEGNFMKLCGFACCVCCSIIILIVILVCVDTIEPIEYGLMYDSISKTIDDSQVYDNGWYWTGATKSFVVFPKTQVNIDFTDYKVRKAPPLQIKDRDGQDIRFQFSMQYKLKKNKIGKLYNEFRTSYEKTFIQKIDFSTRSILGQWNQDAFWNKRAENTELLRKAINQTLQDLHADCVKVQIINIKMSRQRENSLIVTQVTNQKKKTLKNSQQVKQIMSGVDVLSSKANKNITEIRGRANAQMKLILANASANAKKTIIDARTSALKRLKTNVQIDPQNGLDDFLLYNTMQQRNELNVMYNIKGILSNMRTESFN